MSSEKLWSYANSFTKTDVVKFAQLHKTFVNNLSLATSVAIFVTIFGLPVYSSYVSWWIFGEKEQIIHGQIVETCDENMMGVKVNLGSEMQPILVNYNASLSEQGYSPYAWCGLLPGCYFDAWPGVVQYIIFTVFMSTGSTVKLALNCIIGTSTAVLNMYFLSFLYPHGATDPNYDPIIVWLDLAIVLFLYLASNDASVMRMGMNSTIGMMLAFMNPETSMNFLGTYKTWIPGVNFDARPTITMLTAIIGCTLAIVATVFPRPLLNISRVHDDATEITKGLDVCFTDALDYVCGEKRTPQRFQLFAKMSALTTCVKRVENNLADSFWETWNLCHYGRIRALYTKFNKTILECDDQVYLIKAALKQSMFNEGHKQFMATMQAAMHALREETTECLSLCAECCRDGYISDVEKSKIKHKIEMIGQKQADMSSRYQLSMKTAKYVSEDLAAENLFVFALSRWSQHVADFADEISNFESKRTLADRIPVAGLICTAVDAVKSVFDLKAMFAKDNLRFTFSHLIPILFAFYVTTHYESSIFTKYNAIMPGTLCLLVRYDLCPSFFESVQRLMGVTFGKTLPLIALAALQLLDCDSDVRLALHASSVFLFFAAFTYVFYASPHWGSIGLNVAAFGCAPILAVCSSGSPDDFADRYKNIAQVMVAILFNMFVSVVVSPGQPRDFACKRLQAAKEKLEVALSYFFDGRIEGQMGLEEGRAHFKDALAACEEIADMTDPKTEMIPGNRRTFNHELYKKILAQLRLVLSDLDMLVLAMSSTDATAPAEDSEGTQRESGKKCVDQKIFETMRRQEAWEVMKDDCLKTVRLTMGFVSAVLEQDTEEPLKDEAFKEIIRTAKLSKLDGLGEFYAQISLALGYRTDVDEETILKDTRIIIDLQRPRVTVAINALALTVAHLAEMAAQAFESAIY